MQHTSNIRAAYYFHLAGKIYDEVTRIIIDCDECSQVRRQDLAAELVKNQMEGPKTRRGGHIFKTLYWMYGATRGPNVK